MPSPDLPLINPIRRWPKDGEVPDQQGGGLLVLRADLAEAVIDESAGNWLRRGTGRHRRDVEGTHEPGNSLAERRPERSIRGGGRPRRKEGPLMALSLIKEHPGLPVVIPGLLFGQLL